MKIEIDIPDYKLKDIDIRRRIYSPPLSREDFLYLCISWRLQEFKEEDIKKEIAKNINNL